MQTQSAGSLSVPITLQVVPPNPYIYNLPFLAKNYADTTNNNNSGTYTTYLAFQNIGSASANIQLQYFDANGNPVTASGNNCANVPQNGECIPDIPLANGTKGAGIITSNQPLAVIVAEATPYGGTAYPVTEGSTPTLVAPLALNATFGGFSTKINVFNPNAQTSKATLYFYDTAGKYATAVPITMSGHTTVSVDQAAANSGLPVGFQGWALIIDNDQLQLVAQVLEQNPNTGFVAILNAQSVYAATPKVSAPAIFNHGFGSFVTGASLLNIGGEAISATVSYYGSDGRLVRSKEYNVPNYGITNIYNGGSESDVPEGFIGSAVVSSSATTNPIIMAVNESGGGGARQSGVYLAASSGASSVGLPVMAKNGLGYTTGATILNTSDQPVTVSLQYYNLDGTIAGSGVGSQSVTIGPNASYAVYQGAAALGDSFYGTAMVTEVSGPANALLITTNAQSSNFFYTYMEPN